MRSLSSQIILYAEILYTSCYAHTCKRVDWRHWRAGLAANQQRHITVQATMKREDHFFVYFC